MTRLVLPITILASFATAATALANGNSSPALEKRPYMGLLNSRTAAVIVDLDRGASRRTVIVDGVGARVSRTGLRNDGIYTGFARRGRMRIGGTYAVQLRFCSTRERCMSREMRLVLHRRLSDR